MYTAAKDEADPIYLYDPDLVQDATQFYQRQINQHIQARDIERAVAPMRKSPATTASLLQFINILNQETGEAIGTAITQPFLQRGKKSATEAAILQQIAELTASLQSKIIAIGERDFWSHWYMRLINKLTDANKKQLQLTSVTGLPIFESIGLSDIKTIFPPRVEILSVQEANYRELIDKRDAMQMYPQFARTLDSNALRNYNKYVFLPKFIKDSSTIDRIIPKTMDEIDAQQENEMLNNDKFVKVELGDDDEAHLYEHAMAKNTAATWAHRFAHERQLAMKKARQVIQKMQSQLQPQSSGPELNVGGETPEEAASPLKEVLKEQTPTLAKGRGEAKL